MTKWRREDPLVPEYINYLEDVQKKAARASLPISEEWLTTIATSSILAENSLPTAQNKRDKLLIASKKWKKWKDHLVDAQAAIERATRHSGGFFTSTNSDAAFHGIVTAAPTTDPAEDAIIYSGTVTKLNGYPDNLAEAAINKWEVLNCLVANNDRLDTNNATTLSGMKELLTNEVNSGGGGYPARPAHAAVVGSTTS